MAVEKLTGRELKIWREGMKYGLWLYAWWKDGVEYVGTCGENLRKVNNEVDRGEYDEHALISSD